MRCNRCHREAITDQPYSGLHLCAEHFSRDLETKAKRAIRKHRWLISGDRIAVALSGGYASAALLFFLQSLIGKRRDISLSALTLIGLFPDPAMETVIHRIAEMCAVPLLRIPHDRSMPGLHEKTAQENEESTCCISCCVFLLCCLKRHTALNGITSLAVETTLDDRAESVLAHLFRGEVMRLAGKNEDRLQGIRVIHPFMYVPENEVALYAALHLPEIEFPPRTPALGRYAADVREQLEWHKDRHPSAAYSLVNLADGLAALPPAAGRPADLPHFCPVLFRKCTIIQEAGGSGQ
jgi:tRNA(Ile)-lysidine synthase TilS/MesJ